MMQSLSLTHLNYTQLDSTTWCATAQVSASLYLNFEVPKKQASWLLMAHKLRIDLCDFTKLHWQYYASPTKASAREIAHHQRQLQRQGVRQLLQRLLKQLDIDDTLDESHFPYRLRSNRYYVCFSHTAANKNKISKKLNQALNGRLDSRVAVIISSRHPIGIDIENSNIAWRVVQRYYSVKEIAILESLSITQRDHVAKLLWQIKESFIKIHQYTLAQGLGKDYAYLMTDLTDSINKSSYVTVIPDPQSQYCVRVLPLQQTIVIF